MVFDNTLAERIRDGLARVTGIVEKKMFGGIAFLLNGNVCVGVWKDSLIARLGAELGMIALAEPYVREFDITGRAMKGWVLVDPGGLNSDADLDSWLQRAVEFVRTLPPK